MAHVPTMLRFMHHALTNGAVGWVSGSTDPQLHPFGEDRSVMTATLDTIEPLPASVVAFGHGEPFTGSPAEGAAQLALPYCKGPV